MSPEQQLTTNRHTVRHTNLLLTSASMLYGRKVPNYHEPREGDRQDTKESAVEMERGLAGDLNPRNDHRVRNGV